MSEVLKKVLIIHTGGTLGMDLGGTPQDASQFLNVLQQQVPEIFQIANVGVEILFNKDSSNILPRDWVALAQRLNQLFRESWDAFVVIHGTDTMSFTGSALSFMLSHPPKPIIFTGSQRPLKDVKTDAVRNLVHAVEFAVDGRFKEVCVFFDTLLLRANRSKKISIPSFHAFESPNFSALARVGVTTEYLSYDSHPVGEYVFDARIETRVASLTLFPGMDMEIFFNLLQKGIRGVVLQAFGPGDIPIYETSVVPLIRALTEKGIPTVITSQAQFGAVNLSLYETGRAALHAGAISAGDMTWEAAMIKMMILLGRGLSIASFREQYTKNLVGEMTHVRS